MRVSRDLELPPPAASAAAPPAPLSAWRLTGNTQPARRGRVVAITTYQPYDQVEVSRLYKQGLLQGWVDPYDNAADLDDIAGSYLSDRRSHFWVARVDGRVVGMVAASCTQPHISEIRRLRVDPRWQSTSLPTQLIQIALEHCRRHGVLKVIFDTHFHSDTAVELMQRHGFQFTRLRRGNTGKQILEFYSNLYCDDPPQNASP